MPEPKIRHEELLTTDDIRTAMLRASAVVRGYEEGCITIVDFTVVALVLAKLCAFAEADPVFVMKQVQNAIERDVFRHLPPKVSH